MAHGHSYPLLQAAVLELSCRPDDGGHATSVHAGGGAPLASSDAWGTITDAQGRELLRAPIGFDGRRDRGTDATLYVTWVDGTPLGHARVTRYSVGPRSAKATLSVSGARGEVARLEPQDRKGEEIAITAGGRPVGALRRVAQRGLLRKETDYRLELTGELDELTRWLVLTAAIRYHALLFEASTASRHSP